MKNVFLSLLLTLTCCSSLFSQGETTKWYFGSSAAVDFLSGSPVALTNSVMNTSEGSASIADAAGNLLFYTNGSTIWNANHVPMSNGTGLFGSGISCQSAVIVRRPSSTTLYYVFTMRNWTDGGNGAHFSIVDMSLNGGLGDVTTKNQLIYGNTRESLTAVCHANGNDFWIVLHDMVTAEFRSYLLTSAGLSGVPIVTPIGSVFSGGNRYGALKASPDGLKMAYALGGIAGVTTEVYDFDRATGVLNNPIILNNGTYPNAYGVEFSPNSQVLYICEFNGTTIQQVNLAAGSPALIIASKIVISTGANVKANLQLATDNRIYVCLAYQSFIAVITNPNTIGVGCNFMNNALSLLGRTCGLGLPNFMPCYIPIILPESWTFFDAVSEGNRVNLSWGVGNTDPFREFVVERKSALDENYQPIGESVSANLGSGKFESRDFHPFKGNNAYRIKAIRNDGQVEYSAIRNVLFEEARPSVQVYPNPMGTQPLQVSVDHWEGEMNVAIWDVNMKKLMVVSKEIVHQGMASVDLSGLSKGVYFAVVRLGNEVPEVFKVLRD